MRWQRWIQPGLGAIIGGPLLLGLVGFLVPRVYTARAAVVFPLPAATTRLSNPALQMMAGRNLIPEGGTLPVASYRAVAASERALLTVAKELEIPQRYRLRNSQEVVRFMQAALSVSLDENMTMRIEARLRGSPRLSGRDDAQAKALVPQLALKLLDAADQIADDISLDRHKAQLKSTQTRLDLEREVLRQLQDRLQEVRARFHAPDAPAYATELAATWIRCRSELSQLASQRAGAEAYCQQLSRQLERKRGNVADLALQDPYLTERRKDADAARTEYEWASTVYGEENPNLLKAKKRLEQAEKVWQHALALSREVVPEELRRALAQRDSLVAQEEATRRSTAALERELAALSDAARQAAILQAQVTTRLAAVGAAEEQLRTAQVFFEESGFRRSVIDTPYEPVRPSFPSLMKMGLLGTLLGAMLGCLPLLGDIVRWFLAAQATPASGDQLLDG